MNVAHVRWPAERFYFAVLDVSQLPRSGARRAAGLDYLFEPVLPVPLEEVQAAYVPLSRTRVLACGIERRVLRENLPAGARTLAPEQIPEHVADAGAVDPTALNLLIGEFEPADTAKARRATWLEGALLVVAALLLLVVGAERQIQAAEKAQDARIAAEAEMLDRVLGEATRSVATGQRRAMLTGERRRLEQASNGASDVSLPDAARTLQALLDGWPDAPLPLVDSLVVSESAVTLRARVASNEDAARFVGALRPPESFVVQPPQISSVPGAVLLQLRIEREISR